MTSKLSINVLYGGAGFIGTNLALRLANESQSVIVVDLPEAQNWQIVEAIPSIRTLKIVRSQNLVLKLKEIIEEIMNLDADSCEIIFWHLAANSDIQASSQNAILDLENTLQSTINAMKIASELPFVRVFVFASTSAVYGYQPGIKLSENSKLHPISNYGVMKLASEFLIQNTISSEAIYRPIIFRFPNVVGPFLTHGLIYDLLKQLSGAEKSIKVLGNGKQTKQYMHVDELIASMFFLIRHSSESLFNLGPISGSTSVREIVKIFQEVNGNSWEVQYGDEPFGWIGDVPQFELSIEKALSFGVKPSLDSRASVMLAMEQNRVEDID